MTGHLASRLGLIIAQLQKFARLAITSVACRVAGQVSEVACRKTEQFQPQLLAVKQGLFGRLSENRQFPVFDFAGGWNSGKEIYCYLFLGLQRYDHIRAVRSHQGNVLVNRMHIPLREQASGGQYKFC